MGLPKLGLQFLGCSRPRASTLQGHISARHCVFESPPQWLGHSNSAPLGRVSLAAVKPRGDLPSSKIIAHPPILTLSPRHTLSHHHTLSLLHSLIITLSPYHTISTLSSSHSLPFSYFPFFSQDLWASSPSPSLSHHRPPSLSQPLVDPIPSLLSAWWAPGEYRGCCAGGGGVQTLGPGLFVLWVFGPEPD